MRAIRVHSHGGPEVLRHVPDHPEPAPAPTEAVVAVAAIGVNFIDLAHRGGGFGVPVPFTPGVEGAGTVTSVGESVGSLRVGDRVAWALPRPVSSAGGGYAESIALPADRLVPIPDTVDFETAAAVLMHGLTAHYLTDSVYPIRPGDVALVHAAAGGLGMTLTQVIRSRGGRALGTASTPDKAAAARSMGAEKVFGYEAFAAQVREYTSGAGAQVVYDGIGADTIDDSLAAVRHRGTLALIGTASGPVNSIDPARLMTAGSVSFIRPGLPDFITSREELLARADDVFGWLDSAELAVRIGHRYHLADAAEAHRDIAARRTTGKVLLLP